MEKTINESIKEHLFGHNLTSTSEVSYERKCNTTCSIIRISTIDNVGIKISMLLGNL